MHTYTMRHPLAGALMAIVLNTVVVVRALVWGGRR